MKIDSVKNLNIQPKFQGKLMDSTVNFISSHPKAIAGLAGSSVIAQKIVMSGSEATIGPAMDIGVGKVLTTITGEQDGRIDQSSKAQAIRTTSQSIGGTITGLTIRGICIAASTFALMKVGAKASDKIAQIINQNGEKTFSKAENAYEFTENVAAWGKTIGGAIAIGIMMFTNFLLDAPLINFINKKMTNAIHDISAKKASKENVQDKGGVNG